MPAADLDWSDPRTPRSRTFGDIYFSPDDGLAESRAVFLKGCGLPDAWLRRRHFTVAELGFGTGLNLAAVLKLWRDAGPAEARLHLFSVEAHPLNREDAARALGAWPELEAEAASLLARWPEPTPGFHRLDLPGWRATLDLAVGDAAWALDQWSGQADSWFLDGFAPAVNPAMWSAAVLDGVRARSAPGARLASFTVAGAVRRGLAERGFAVAKRPGHGQKRERLEARLSGLAADPGTESVVIVGAGVAGAALARALRAVGREAVVVAPAGDDRLASDFPAALATPRFDLGDAAIADLNAQALARAATLYDDTPGAVIDRGVLRLEDQRRDPARFDRLAAQPIWPEGAMVRLDAVEAGSRAGQDVTRGGLWMRDARVVRPSKIREAWLADAARIDAEVEGIEAGGEGRWRVVDRHGRLLVEARTVVLCAGWRTTRLAPDLPLSPARGQVTETRGGASLSSAIAWGGYAVATGTGLLFGATHQRGEDDTTPRPEDDRANLEGLAAVLPALAAGIDPASLTGRAAVRATTPDRLPLCGALPGPPGLHVLGGLGSRGFLMAPLLAEHLAAVIGGTPSPLPTGLARRIAPDRFATERAGAQPR